MDYSQLMLTSFYRIDSFQGCSSMALMYAAGSVQSGFISVRSCQYLETSDFSAKALGKLEVCVHLANVVKSIQLYCSKYKTKSGMRMGDKESGNLLESEENCL